MGKAAWRIRRVLKQRNPRIVLGFTTVGSILAVLASRGLCVPVIATERVDPGGHGQRIGRLRASLRDVTYARADHVVVQTSRARRALPWLSNDRVSIIANPIHPIAGQARSRKPAVRTAVFESRRRPARSPKRVRSADSGLCADLVSGFQIGISSFMVKVRNAPHWRCWRARSPAGRIRLPGITSDIEAALARRTCVRLSLPLRGLPQCARRSDGRGIACCRFSRCQRRRGLDRDGSHLCRHGTVG